MDEHETAILKMINKRIDDLATSYQVLNDNHGNLEISVAELRTEWKTTKSWVKYVFGTSLLGFLISVVSLLKMFNVI